MRILRYRNVLPVLLIALSSLAMNAQPALATSGDHFRPSGRNPLVPAGSEDALFTPQDFENEAAAHPNANNAIFVSRCRFAPFTSTSIYNSLAGTNTADAIVGDTLVTLANNTHCYNPQNETPIAINPTNPLNVVTSANEYRNFTDAVYYSKDGGKTWTNVFLPGRNMASGGTGLFSQMEYCGDPSVAFGPDGTLFYAGLACSTSKLGFLSSGVSVSISKDGGATWSAPTMIGYNSGIPFFNDKEWITAGPNGAVYVTWTRFNGGPLGQYYSSPIVIAISRDNGKTWSGWKPVSDPAHPYNQGSVPQVAPNGTLYVAYEGSTPSSGYRADAIIVARSTDGGNTFTNVELARAYDDYNCYPINVDQGRQTLSGEQFRINSLPSFALDPTNGHLAITWADDQANPGCGYEKGGAFSGVTSNQVKLITSNDGLTWTSPRLLTSGSADKVYPAVGANNGRVVVTYYTRAYSPSTDLCKAMMLDQTTNTLFLVPGPVCLDYAARSSSDNFGQETRLTSQSSNPYIIFAGAFIGDYTGAAVNASGTGFAAWTDFRGNPGVTFPNQDVDVQRGY